MEEFEEVIHVGSAQVPGDTQPEAEVDVARVPVYPVVRLALSGSTDGDVARGTCDGRPVAEGSPAAVRQALLEEAACVAARRPVQAVRVALVGDGFDAPFGVVTATGELLETEAQTDPRPSRRARWMVIAVAGAVALGAGGVAGVAFAVSHGWGRPPQAVQAAPTPTPTQIPVAAPPGWSSVATWSYPVSAGLSESSIPSATVQGRHLVFAPDSSAGSVVALDEQTGAKVWASSLPGGSSLVGGPAVVGMGQSLVVVAWSSTDLVAWEAATGAEIGAWPLGSATQVFVSDGRIVAGGQTPHVAVLGASGLQWRVLAAGATPVGATPDGQLIATAEGRAWMTDSNEVAGESAALPAPQGTAWVAPVGYSDGALVVAYAPQQGNGTVLRAYRAANGAWTTLWTSQTMPTETGATTSSDMPLKASADGSWGVVGTSWVDLRTGSVRQLPADWRTTAVGTAGALGVANGGVGFVSRLGSVNAPAGEGNVVASSGLTDSNTALIVATDGEVSHLYAVPAARAPQVASGAPSTATSGASR